MAHPGFYITRPSKKLNKQGRKILSLLSRLKIKQNKSKDLHKDNSRTLRNLPFTSWQFLFPKQMRQLNIISCRWPPSAGLQGEHVTW